MQRTLTVSLFVFVVCVAAACRDQPLTPPLELEEGCNPLLGGVDCFVPYPSDVFLVADKTMPSGRRIETSGAAKLETKNRLSADVNDFVKSDGFSRTPTIVALLTAPIKDEGLTHIFDDPRDATLSTSKALVLDAETGEALPLLVDLDARATDDGRRALLLRPLLRLKELHRYVVVLRGLTDLDDVVQTAPEGYRRLRDKVDVSNDNILGPLAARYERDVFPVLAAAKVDRDDTQLAWDFTTGSDVNAMGDMLRVRALVLDEVAHTAPTVRVFGSVERVDDPAWRVVSGEITGPSVMEGDGGPGELLARDAEGLVRLNGEVTFPFTAVVPASVRDEAGPGATVLFGHGFFGGGGEIESDATRGVLNGAHAVGFAIDWAGMSSEDVGIVVAGVGDTVSESLRFGERVPQGMANWLSLTAAIKNGTMQDVVDGSGKAPFRRPDGPDAGAVVYDASAIDYLGISQGHILGSVMTTLNPDVRRVALEVGGAAFTHMMSRARPFRTYLALLDISMVDSLEQQKLIATYQRGFDRFDPGQYSAYLLREDLPSGPPSNREQKRVLMQIGIGDDQVPNFTSWSHARIVGLPVVTPSVREVPLMETAAAPLDGSGLVIFDFGDDDAFYATAAPATTSTRAHEALRRRPEAQAQLRRFFADGVIENSCGEGGCSFVE